MSKNDKNLLIITGIGLVGIGITPTPDDVTVISPLLQIGVGVILIGIGAFAK